MTLTTPPHPYAQQMMNNLPNTTASSIPQSNTPYPVLQGASSLPSASSPMVQLPVLPHQQQLYPTLQGASYMPYGMNNQPIPPVQFVGQQTYPTVITTEPIQIQQQQPIPQYTTTITTTTTTVDGNGGIAQAPTEDSTMRMNTTTSVLKQMFNKLKTRVRSPTALIGSLCNLLALTLLLQIIGVIWFAANSNRFPVFIHVVFWILVVLQSISMLLKSPIMMVLNLALNLVCLIGTMANGYGILMSLFFFSSIFCVKLGFRYLIKVNAKKQAASDLENTGEVSQANAETLKSRNPVLAFIDSLKNNQKFVIEYKLSDLLIGAE